ncbi:NAD(P)H-dependent oxidoreductase [Lentisphaerota bacterium WC36G]|nr:NAD(P)H-dependent oxidoreductase [Lentisphaerae bacterium WC36]
MNYLIVNAFTDDDEFHLKMTESAKKIFQTSTDQLHFSNLYDLGFYNLKATQLNLDIKTIEKFNMLNCEQFSIVGNSVEDRIVNEIDKVAEADVIIFQYPMQWMNTPKIIFKWINEVFESFEPISQRWYDYEDLSNKVFATAITTPAEQNFYEQYQLRNGADGLNFALRSHLKSITKQECKTSFVAWHPLQKSLHHQQQLLNKFENFLKPKQKLSFHKV